MADWNSTPMFQGYFKERGETLKYDLKWKWRSHNGNIGKAKGWYAQRSCTFRSEDNPDFFRCAMLLNGRISGIFT